MSTPCCLCTGVSPHNIKPDSPMGHPATLVIHNIKYDSQSLNLKVIYKIKKLCNHFFSIKCYNTKQKTIKNIKCLSCFLESTSRSTVQKILDICPMQKPNNNSFSIKNLLLTNSRDHTISFKDSNLSLKNLSTNSENPSNLKTVKIDLKNPSLEKTLKKLFETLNACLEFLSDKKNNIKDNMQTSNAIMHFNNILPNILRKV